MEKKNKTAIKLNGVIRNKKTGKPINLGGEGMVHIMEVGDPSRILPSLGGKRKTPAEYRIEIKGLVKAGKVTPEEEQELLNMVDDLEKTI